MLTVTGAAAVTTRKNLPFINQTLHHHLAGDFNKRRQYFAGIGFGINAGIEMAEYTGLKVHQGFLVKSINKRQKPLAPNETREWAVCL